MVTSVCVEVRFAFQGLRRPEPGLSCCATGDLMPALLCPGRAVSTAPVRSLSVAAATSQMCVLGHTAVRSAGSVTLTPHEGPRGPGSRVTSEGSSEVSGTFLSRQGRSQDSNPALLPPKPVLPVAGGVAVCFFPGSGRSTVKDGHEDSFIRQMLAEFLSGARHCSQKGLLRQRTQRDPWTCPQGAFVQGVGRDVISMNKT